MAVGWCNRHGNYDFGKVMLAETLGSDAPRTLTAGGQLNDEEDYNCVNGCQATQYLWMCMCLCVGVCVVKRV